MKFGVRECCDVVFRAKAKQKVGNKWFFKDEPVIYFESLKTSSLEGAANTVYATGGRGNAQLMAWEGERTLKFTMEDALISAEGISILTGAGIIEASASNKIYVHKTATIKATDANHDLSTDRKSLKIQNLQVVEDGKVVAINADENHGCYVMVLDSNGNIITEPLSTLTVASGSGRITVVSNAINTSQNAVFTTALKEVDAFLVDFYQEKTSGVYQIDIEPNKFGGYYYIEASTLFRDQATGVDMPAEFIIPTGKVQSNFTFTMAGSGDPSTFTFTIDAFPGRVKGTTKDVLAAIQVIEEDVAANESRASTEQNDSAVGKPALIGPESIANGQTEVYTLINSSNKITGVSANPQDGISVQYDDDNVIVKNAIAGDEDKNVTITATLNTSSSDPVTKTITAKKA